MLKAVVLSLSREVPQLNKNKFVFGFFYLFVILRIWCYLNKNEWFLSEMIVLVCGEKSVDLFRCLRKSAAFSMSVTTDYSWMKELQTRILAVSIGFKRRRSHTIDWFVFLIINCIKYKTDKAARRLLIGSSSPTGNHGQVRAGVSVGR